MKRLLVLLISLFLSAWTGRAQQLVDGGEVLASFYVDGIAWTTSTTTFTPSNDRHVIFNASFLTPTQSQMVLASSGQYKTGRISFRMVPGKTYTLEIRANNRTSPTPYFHGINGLNLVADIPAGYILDIDDVPRETKSIWISDMAVETFIYPKVRIRSIGSAGGAAGDATPLATERSPWSLSLGTSVNGGGAGTLSFVDGGFYTSLSSVFVKENLICDAGSSDVAILPASTTDKSVRQVVAPQVVVDVIWSSANVATIKCYHPSQRSADLNASGVFTFTGSPFVTYFLNRNSTAYATVAEIECERRDITSSADNNAAVSLTTKTKITISGDVWTAQGWYTGTSPLTISTRTRTGTPAVEERRALLADNTNQAAYVKRTFGSVVGGEELVSEQVGTDTENPISNTFAYYTTATSASDYGKLKSISSNNGSWQYFVYNVDGKVSEIYSPFANTPAMMPASFDASFSGMRQTNTYELDAFGRKSRPGTSNTYVGGTLVSSVANTYSTDANAFVAFGHPKLRLVTMTQSVKTNATESLSTVTKIFSEDAGAYAPVGENPEYTDDFFRGQVHSIVTPAGTKTSYLHQRGTWSGTTFTLSGNGGLDYGTSSRVSVINGLDTSSSLGDLYNAVDGYPIDALRLVSGKSTKQVYIRDQYSNLVRTEFHVWSGGVWNLVSWEAFEYNLRHQLTRKTSSKDGSGAIRYDATYTGDRLSGETNEDATTVSYTYDAEGRVDELTKQGVITKFNYDAVGRKTKETYGSGLTNPIISVRAYDQAGRLTRETSPAGGVVTHAYVPSERKYTVTLPSGATRVEIANLDGSPQSVTGTGVVNQYFDNATFEATTAYRLSTVRIGSSTSGRASTTTTDWAGRTLKTTGVGAPSGGGNFSLESSTQYSTKGLPIVFRRTGYRPIRIEYDEFGAAKRQGLDYDNDGLLTLASLDRISDSEQIFEQSGGAWWAKTVTKTYPKDNDSTAFSSTTRTRLSGFSNALISESETTDVEGNISTKKVTLDRANKRLTIVTRAAGLDADATEIVENGLRKSVTGPDGNTATYAYDAYNRLSSVTDSRSNTSITTYEPGTYRVKDITDAANNKTSYVYDTSDRVTGTSAPLSSTVYTSYTLRGEVYRQWGGGTYPVEYEYNSYGERIKMTTYRTNSASTWSTATWPANIPAATDGSVAGDVTAWTYDPASGVLTSKKDAAEKEVTFTYNERGQTKTIVSGRGHTTTYAYFDATAELDSITYGSVVSGTETILTDPVSYKYRRSGMVKEVTDGTGVRTFDVDVNLPFRQTSETLPAFYGSRVITTLYENATAASTTAYNGYTPYTLKGRTSGYELRTAGNAVELHNHAVWTGNGRLVGINVGDPVNYVYSYHTSGLLDGYSVGAGAATFVVNRTYETNRNLVSRIKAAVGSETISQFDYRHTALGQRSYAEISGKAFSDYNGSVYRSYNYNTRGELVTSDMYRGAAPAEGTPPNANAALPGRRFEFRYDEIGNRTLTGESEATGDLYTTNKLNQYTTRENKTVRVIGTISIGGKVAVRSAHATNAQTGLAASVKDGAYGATLLMASDASPIKGSVEVYGSIPGTSGALDKQQKVTREFEMAAYSQVFVYDSDGNTIGDGVRDFFYDGANRLVMVRTSAAAASGSNPYLATETRFKYDYMGRRVEKTVTRGVIVQKTRYVYAGWNVIAELSVTLDGANAEVVSLYRTFHWGLDLVGSLAQSGGVGALLGIAHNGGDTYLPTFDANGNVAAVVRKSDGQVVAAYEYGPFGEALRTEGSYALTNPFRFSTKWHDAETRLVYFGHRYYSPDLGRFINRDPIAEQGGLNLYGFCGNDGVDRWDYLGYSWLSKAFRSVGKFLKKYWKPIVAVVVGVLTAGAAIYALLNYAAGLGMSTAVTFGQAMSLAITGTSSVGSLTMAGAAISGAVTGFVAGTVGAKLNGAGWGSALKTGIKQGGISALTAGLMAGVDKARPDWLKSGNVPAPGQSWMTSERVVNQVERLGMRAAISGGASELAGGEFKDGARLSFFTDAAKWGTEAFMEGRWRSEVARGLKANRDDLGRLRDSEHTWATAEGGPVMKNVGESVADARVANVGIPMPGTPATSYLQAANRFLTNENGWLQYPARYLPGFNNLSIFHDYWATWLDRPGLFGTVSGLVTSQATIAPVLAGNYLLLGSQTRTRFGYYVE